MTASLDPKFFQILPTRALPPEAALNKSRRGGRVPLMIVENTPTTCEELQRRVRALRPNYDPERIARLVSRLETTLTAALASNWKLAQRIIAQAAGDTLAISIIGPLSESPAPLNRLVAGLDDNTINDELTGYEDSSVSLHNTGSVTPRPLGTDQAGRVIETTLDAMEKHHSRRTSLDHACVVTVRSLVRERCASLIAPVRLAIEKELSFEFAATSEITVADPPPSPRASTANGCSGAVNDALEAGDIEQVAHSLAAADQIGLAAVQRAISESNARAICALAWKAGLPASVAAAIQIHIAMIPPHRTIRPSADGSYALTAQELSWQIEILVNDPRPVSLPN
ncbi:hypothetical protein AA23498_1832 [Acetobacter nitrogenifigens DSM 23921 = NBRC 105050]|uniref:Uncharacterized protein n=1 Tax=Acetobacter nitrogenifigens DSM 23921 = NBRC 105050 TaxID=1120919 RepID=A0A511X9S7_9PROT|nr:DUF2336 domain-containing protein [Acetobacter nitrogenifigens]GBQ93786.1 hypothetical protein AA23498_1832 [Acetobacter nitrogenifigens DSM 23921 = NBRC 105050]GEN59671.1 hypothetical protein ANI02nite_15550 [Acetobacter nitrogenifigens DSM 23921 = NBRC 105050]